MMRSTFKVSYDSGIPFLTVGKDKVYVDFDVIEDDDCVTFPIQNCKLEKSRGKYCLEKYPGMYVYLLPRNSTPERNLFHPVVMASGSKKLLSTGSGSLEWKWRDNDHLISVRYDGKCEFRKS